MSCLMNKHNIVFTVQKCSTYKKNYKSCPVKGLCYTDWLYIRIMQMDNITNILKKRINDD